MDLREGPRLILPLAVVLRDHSCLLCRENHLVRQIFGTQHLSFRCLKLLLRFGVKTCAFTRSVCHFLRLVLALKPYASLMRIGAEVVKQGRVFLNVPYKRAFVLILETLLSLLDGELLDLRQILSDQRLTIQH